MFAVFGKQKRAVQIDNLGPLRRQKSGRHCKG
jgi:hypothetical protein